MMSSLLMIAEATPKCPPPNMILAIQYFDYYKVKGLDFGPADER
jgi:hypothetical protein